MKEVNISSSPAAAGQKCFQPKGKKHNSRGGGDSVGGWSRWVRSYYIPIYTFDHTTSIHVSLFSSFFSSSFLFFDHRGHYPGWTPPKSWWSHLLLKPVLSHALHPRPCSWYSAQVSRFRPGPPWIPFLICTCCAVVREASAADKDHIMNRYAD